jgi:hypothetical protein
MVKLDKGKDITMRWYVTHVMPIGAFAAVSLALGGAVQVEHT